jgi:hypothetical protein
VTSRMSSIACLPFSQNLSNKVFKNIGKKQKYKEMSNLGLFAYTLLLQTMSSPLKFFFWVQTNWFSFQNYAM